MTDDAGCAEDADVYLSDYLKPDQSDTWATRGAFVAGIGAGYHVGDMAIGAAVAGAGAFGAYAANRLYNHEEGREAARNSLEHFRGLWNRDTE